MDRAISPSVSISSITALCSMCFSFIVTDFIIDWMKSWCPKKHTDVEQQSAPSLVKSHVGPTKPGESMAYFWSDGPSAHSSRHGTPPAATYPSSEASKQSTAASSPLSDSSLSPAHSTSTRASSLSSQRALNRIPSKDPQCQHRVTFNLDDGNLPPIDEDSDRFIQIPVQDAPVEIRPSIATVERVAAVKAALEIQYSSLLTAASPRDLRRRRFEKQLAERHLAHDDRIAYRRQWLHAERDLLRQTRVLKTTSLARSSVRGVTIPGFEMVRVLGKGSFGVVRLVTERQTNGSSPAGSDTASNCKARGFFSGRTSPDVFAMKVIRKSEMLRSCQEAHLRAERDFLVNAEGSRWVVPLIASFQDNTNLYLVMEYMIGGDFLGLLLREDVLDEAVAR